MKKLFVLCVLAGCLMGCGTTSSNSAQANVQQSEISADKSAIIESSIVEEKIESVMLAEYPDIQDFGKTYGVAENEEKEELLKSMYPDAWGMLVYDVPEENKEDIETWKQALEESGFVIAKQTDADDGVIITYASDKSKEQILVSTGPSTDNPTETVMTVTITDFSLDGVLPTKDDPDMDKIIEEQNRAQVNGDYLIQDGWIYGLTWKDNGDAIFSKKRLDGTDYTKMLDGYLTNIFLEDAYIYGVKVSGKKQGIYKMRASGEDCKCILEGEGITMQVCDGYIYYTPNSYTHKVTDEIAHLYRCDLDGNSIEEIIAKPVYCWYVFDEAIIYQDDRDNESLHIFNLKKQTDIKLNNMTSYSPIYDGEYIYYSGKTEDKCNVWKVTTDGSENKQIGSVQSGDKVVLYKDDIYFVNEEDNARIYKMNKDGSNLTQISQDKNCEIPYFSGDKLIYEVYEKNYKYIEKNVMCDPDGSNAEKIQLR